MKVWQVAGNGEGFNHGGVERACELFGFVQAEDAQSAFSKACELAARDHPELSQAAGPFPRPVINADEVYEVDEAGASAIDSVELHWCED